MRFCDTLYLVLRNLACTRRKNSLTMTAIAIGVASVMLLSALGNGGVMTAESELKKLGIDGLSLRMVGGSEKLDPEDAKYIRKSMQEVDSALPFIFENGYVKLHGMSDSAMIWGVGEGMVRTLDVELLYGRDIGAADLRENARVAVIDDDFAYSAYKRVNIVGKFITVSINGMSEPYEVIGVISSQIKSLKSILGVNISTFVYVPYTTVNELKNTLGVDQIAISCAAGFDTEKITEDIVSLMSRTRETEGQYIVENITSYLDNAKQIVRVVTLLVTAAGAVSLIVAGVGVMNAMLSRVEERRREIGLYLAVGAMEKDIVKNFLLESILICLLGGFLGVLSGYGMILIVNHYTVFPAFIKLGDILAPILTSGIFGFAFGVIPAIKASRLQPVDALRQE